MRTFENDHAFVELFAKGNAVHHRWGRKGTPGQSRVDTHATPLDAAREFDRQVHQLAARYRPGIEEQALREAIRATPESAAPLLVYADWLTQKGDPLGEIIFADHGDAASRKGLLAAHRVHLEPRFEPPATFVWHCGFIVTARIQGWHPATIEQLFRHPSSLIIQTLVIANTEQNLDQQRWVDVLTRGRPASLKEIQVNQRKGLDGVARHIPGLTVFKMRKSREPK